MTNPLFDTIFGRHLDRATVFLQLPDGSSLTHAEFLGRAAQLAHLFVDMGLRPGDRVAMQIEKSPEALMVYAACLQSGLIFLPLNTAYTAPEVAYFVEDCGAALLICDSGAAAALAPVARKAGAFLETLGAGGTGSLAERSRTLPRRFDTMPRDADDLAALLYTSGTTGRSKGAMLTQANLLSNAETLAKAWRFTASDVLLHALPVFHTHGLFVATNVSLIGGGQMIFLPRFDIDQVLARLPAATTMMGVPTFYTRLLAQPGFTAELVAHMRLFVSGSAPLSAETHAEFEARTGHRILERYGMTETNMNTSNPYAGERRPGTVGFPLPGVELRITGEADGGAVREGEIGMIEVRGPNVFKGYWAMPEKTAQELRPDGFFLTGDLGRVDADGYLHIVGRSKDLIISGGYNIYPKEVEILLDAEDGVLESAVIGVPHADFGETVVGVLVAEAGAVLDLDAIGARLGASLARFKHPKRLVVVPELPRNAMGKVQKAELRRQFGDLFVAS